MRFGFFLLFDGLGSALWLGLLLAAGRLFDDLLRRDPRLLDWAGKFSRVFPALGILGCIHIYWSRKHFINNEIVILSERGPQALFSLGVVSRRICFCLSINFEGTTLAADISVLYMSMHPSVLSLKFVYKIERPSQGFGRRSYARGRALGLCCGCG